MDRVVFPDSNESRPRVADGFSLIEVLVAIALLSGALLGVVQLFALSSRAQLGARDSSYASILAEQKLHELLGTPLAEMSLSSPDAWRRTTSGHVEYLGTAGDVLGTSGAIPGGVVYVRRWSVTPLVGDVSGGVIVEVAVGRLRRVSASDAAETDPASASRVVGIKTGTVP